MIADRERLIFALDVPETARAKVLVQTLGSSVVHYKIGLELLMSGGYFDLLEWLLKRDKKVFVDLKFFDVPATVARAIKNLSQLGAHFATIHGQQAAMEAAAEAKSNHLQVLAVTALTSLDQGDLHDFGFQCDVNQLVVSRARRALAAGLDGVVCSGLELPHLRQAIDPRLIAVTPGIRPVSNDENSDDQKRILTPKAAILGGADYLVIGRPIRDADDPQAMAESIQADIAAAMAARG